MSITRDTLNAYYPDLPDDTLRGIAVDVAFDYFLDELCRNDFWRSYGAAFIGGTAVRKFHCPPETYKRISFDCDIMYSPKIVPRSPHPAMTTRKGQAWDGFSFRTRYVAGRNSIEMSTPFFDEPIEAKADLLPRWLLQRPEPKPPTHRPIRDAYRSGMDLPVPVMSAAEVVAAKLARWQAEPRVRDLYDLHHMLPLIEDTELVALMMVIKCHQETTAPFFLAVEKGRVPLSTESLTTPLGVGDMVLSDLVLDHPVHRDDMEQLVSSMLNGLPDVCGHIVEATQTGALGEWSTDTTGVHAGAVADAARRLARSCQAPRQSGPSLT